MGKAINVYKVLYTVAYGWWLVGGLYEKLRVYAISIIDCSSPATVIVLLVNLSLLSDFYYLLLNFLHFYFPFIFLYFCFFFCCCYWCATNRLLNWHFNIESIWFKYMFSILLQITGSNYVAFNLINNSQKILTFKTTVQYLEYLVAAVQLFDKYSQI